MGYDVTFHCLSEKELNRYVFDVLEDPRLSLKRASEITKNPEHISFLDECVYAKLTEWFVSGPESINGSLTETFYFAIASISGFLHPYWYARNQAISFNLDKIPDAANLFVGLSSLSPSLFGRFASNNDLFIMSNYHASGFLKDVKPFRLWLEKHKDTFRESFDDEGFDSLFRALNYCERNNLYLIEASDLVIPLTNEAQTDLQNLKAHFLKNVDIQENKSWVTRLFKKFR